MNRISLAALVSIGALLAASACGGKDDDDPIYVHASTGTELAHVLNENHYKEVIVSKGGNDPSVYLDESVTIQEGVTVTVEENTRLVIQGAGGLTVNNGANLIIEEGSSVDVMNNHLVANTGAAITITESSELNCTNTAALTLNSAELHNDGKIGAACKVTLNAGSSLTSKGKATFQDMDVNAQDVKVTNLGKMVFDGMLKMNSGTFDNGMEIGVEGTRSPASAETDSARITNPYSKDDPNLVIHRLEFNSGTMTNYAGWWTKVEELKMNSGTINVIGADTTSFIVTTRCEMNSGSAANVSCPD